MYLPTMYLYSRKVHQQCILESTRITLGANLGCRKCPLLVCFLPLLAK